MTITVKSGGSINGLFSVPGDKSIAQRALIISSIAEGTTRISGFPDSLDCGSALACLRSLGADIEKNGSEVAIRGRGLYGFEPSGPLDAGNSATAMRLLAGVLAAQNFDSELFGDESLRSRPMDRIIEPLRAMGADISSSGNDGRPPLIIRGAALRAVDYRLPVASAQVKSCLLLAGLYAAGTTVIFEHTPTRDHTEIALKRFGADIEASGGRVSLKGGGKLLSPGYVAVPGDFSCAAYLIAVATLLPGSDISVQNVGVNETRTGFVSALREMGADIRLSGERTLHGEPVADISASYSELQGADFSGKQIPAMIDEIPLLAVAACFARGRTIISGAEELRRKESDRLSAVSSELRKMGAEIEETPGGLIIDGTGKLFGARAETHSDHRIEMALAVAALRASGETAIEDANRAAVSFPGFYPLIFGARH